MDALLPLFLGLAMLATVGVLVLGIVGFAVNGKFYQRNSNKLMRMRVLFQGVAIAIVGLLALLGVSAD
jgi:hypothetical protein